MTIISMFIQQTAKERMFQTYNELLQTQVQLYVIHFFSSRIPANISRNFLKIQYPSNILCQMVCFILTFRNAWYTQTC